MRNSKEYSEVFGSHFYCRSPSSFQDDLSTLFSNNIMLRKDAPAWDIILVDDFMPFFSHLLIGIPASGKSTFAEHLATLTNAKIISTDVIRATLYGDSSIQGDWNEVASEIIKQIQLLITQGTPAIYDATNAKRVWRLEFLQRLENEGISWIAWYLDVPLEVCKERNRKRDRHVPESIIEHLYQSLQDFPPDVTEGFAAIKIVKSLEFDSQSIQRQIDSLTLRHSDPNY